ncbi:MAG TPA: hypothetical protein VFF79_01525 [Conexibacter sp.]|jgi:hypothetical protein|nr:hypothetical protein [Conexibacter sp.]
MRIRTTLALVGAVVTLAMALTAGSASANRLSLGNNTFRITWSALRFIEEAGFVVGEVRCPVTLEGSFHERTFRKTRGALIGYVTRTNTNVAGCVGGAANFLPESLPWHIRYTSFTGRLPAITGIRVLFEDVEFRTLIAAIECLYSQETVESISGEFFRVGGGQILTFAFDGTTHLEKLIGGPFCPPEGALEGTGESFILGTTSHTFLLLI